MGYGIDKMARDVTNRRGISPSRTRYRSHSIRNESRGTSSVSDRGSWGIGGTNSSTQERNDVVMERRNVYLPRLHAKKVSFRTWLAYWIFVGITAIGAGVLWGF